MTSSQFHRLNLAELEGGDEPSFMGLKSRRLFTSSSIFLGGAR
jgi:hypothetical protein